MIIKQEKLDKYYQEMASNWQVLEIYFYIQKGPIDPETGVPRTKFLTLSGITSPDFSTFDKENPRQQPFGFKAREYLRNLIQGQKVQKSIIYFLRSNSLSNTKLRIQMIRLLVTSNLMEKMSH